MAECANISAVQTFTVNLGLVRNYKDSLKPGYENDNNKI